MSAPDVKAVLEKERLARDRRDKKRAKRRQLQEDLILAQLYRTLDTYPKPPDNHQYVPFRIFGSDRETDVILGLPEKRTDGPPTRPKISADSSFVRSSVAEILKNQPEYTDDGFRRLQAMTAMTLDILVDPASIARRPKDPAGGRLLDALRAGEKPCIMLKGASMSRAGPIVGIMTVEVYYGADRIQRLAATFPPDIPKDFLEKFVAALDAPDLYPVYASADWYGGGTTYSIIGRTNPE
jgi:hypothetical protein